MKVYCGALMVVVPAWGFQLKTPAVFKQQQKTTKNWAVDKEGEEKKKVVVIGNGPVGQRFVEDCVKKADEWGVGDKVEVTSFCEERLAAYNRVQLTKWFETRTAQALSMVGDYDSEGQGSWYSNVGNADVKVGEKATQIDTARKVVVGDKGSEVEYDAAVFATGSYPFVPPIEGKDLKGVFVYRTIDDLESLVEYCREKKATKAAVLGGGLLGLEAAKAVSDLGLSTSILEYAPILLCRQIDRGGHDALVGKIEGLGLDVKCDARVTAFQDDGTGAVKAVKFGTDGWDDLEVDVVVVSAGIRPRDEVARASEVDVHERGGIQVDDTMKTSQDSVYAVGECALHRGKIYGLVAPGYQQAAVASDAILRDLFFSGSEGALSLSPDAAEPASFQGADLSTKLKLLGCDVANFGAVNADPDTPQKELVWNDPIAGVYRKLIVDPETGSLHGGVLVGDAGDYSDLYKLFKAQKPIDFAAHLPPVSARGSVSLSGTEEEDDDPATQICSCNDVSRGALIAACAEFGDKTTYDVLKAQTKAGTGCGGCEPDVKKLLNAELAKMGAKVDNHLCEHFHHSRPELMALVQTGGQTSFDQVLAAHGVDGAHDGCEICKPAIASMLATLENGVVLKDGRAALQDTNDRSLANMQRGGSYSVVPRVPGGEILPEQLVTMGDVAKKYGLYAKITGAQRIDLFGAAKHDLPQIWQDLGEAGLESGHAYGKALRTVKSCVGSSWCRYGVQNSVDFAITVENRYKGLRAPHKLKSAVSGCIRECAEAQCKDFGMIAVEGGYDLYLCGNGGANPRHGALFASGIDEATVLKYLDRFLMYYCLTGERLERTARWFERLGPNDEVRLKALQDVVIHDSLGINDELERRMQHVVDTYHDEWAVVVSDPELRAQFERQFANTDEKQSADDMIEFMDVRGQRRPVDWAPDGAPQTNWKPPSDDVFARSQKSWVAFGPADDFPVDLGTPVLYGESQLAVFRTKAGDWYATQNMCPHKQAFVLAQGVIGLKGDAPKVACPLHKKQFGLADGKQLDGELEIITFPVRVHDGQVQLELPARDEVDAVLGTSKLRVCQQTPDLKPVFKDDAFVSNSTQVYAR